MTETLSLSWDAHQKNICSGLSLLQQQGEFVDMTLAADGHHVKVHQMVLSLASPYIKSLISSAQCPHPVVFLNNISHTILISILEYIYTGEAHIQREHLSDLIAAGKALQIKGLKEMDEVIEPQNKDSLELNPLIDTETSKLRKPKRNKKSEVSHNEVGKASELQLCKVFVDSADDDHDYEMTTESVENTDTIATPDDSEKLNKTAIHSLPTINKNKEYYNPADVHYSMSNQGNLQLVVNRYIYNLKYVQKNMKRYWRCVDYAYRKCPASVYTSNTNLVLKRKSSHNHPFHDAKILKKIRLDIIFKAFSEAQSRAQAKKLTDTVEMVTAPVEDIDESE